MRRLELVGRRFGKLVDRHGASMWLCQCDCGKRRVIRGSRLSRGTTRSCGCGVIEAARLPKKHGHTGSPLWIRWAAMINRCESRRRPGCSNYAGRGIRVCKRWRESFLAFADDMGSMFAPYLELDRIDNNGNYEPGNCRWISHRQQQRNKRTNHVVKWRGRQMTIQEWGELLQIKPNSIITRLRRGWDVDRALSKGADTRALEQQVANG